MNKTEWRKWITVVVRLETHRKLKSLKRSRGENFDMVIRRAIGMGDLILK